MSANNTTSATTPFPTLAQEYNNVGWKAELVVGISPPWLIATIGVFFNLFLVLVTIKCRMSNWCNILIAIDAGFCALSELGYTVSWFVYVTGLNAISQTSCFCFLFIPSLGYVLSFGSMLIIALERLFATFVLQPNASMVYRKLVYAMLLGNGLLGLYYAVIFVLNFLANLNSKKPSQVNCNYGDLFLPGYVWTFYYLSVGIVCLAGLCYLLIGIILVKRRNQSHLNMGKEDNYTRRIYRSLLVITLMVVGSQLASLIWRVTKAPGGYTPALASYYGEKANYCLTYFANTASAPVLYLMSTDYRKAFKSLRFNIFSIFDCFLKKQVQIAPEMTVTRQIISHKIVVNRQAISR